MNTKQAGEGLLHLGKQYAAVIKAGEILREIGDLEQAKAEADNQAAIAKQAAAAATRAQEQAESELRELQAAIETAAADKARIVAETGEAFDRKREEHDEAMAQFAQDQEAAQAELDRINAELAAVKERIIG